MHSLAHSLITLGLLLATSSSISAIAGESQLTRISGGAFQGNWEHCDHLNDAHWGKGKVCSSYVLLQNKKNICGTWSYWATGTTYEGQLQMTAIRKNTAKKDLICGVPGSETQTECANEYTPEGGWEAYKGYMMVCQNALLTEATQDKTETSPIAKYCDRYYTRKTIPARQIKELLAEPWMQQCLTRP